MSNFLKATAVRDTVVDALVRQLTLAPTVWVNGAGSFRGALGDTITVRVPAYTVADSRALRSGTTRQRRGLFESSVPVTLTRDLYRDVVLTDEQQTLDIMDFGRQVMAPMLASIARGIEDVLIVDAMRWSAYAREVDIDISDPFASVVEARQLLNDSRVPLDGNRTLAVGSSIEALLLSDAQFRNAYQSGTTATLREGEIGRIAGFSVLTSPGLPPDEAYAYHQTAYALAVQAPVVPTGFTGFVAQQDGFAIRMVQVPDSATIENVVAADVFVGASPVKDHGTIGTDGVFTPSATPDLQSNSDQLFVRAVKLGTNLSS